MKSITIVVADASRARIFTLVPELRAASPSAGLVERHDLVDPARRQRPGELLSESRPPSNRTPTGLGFAVDDHRDEYMRELDRRFAAEIFDQAMKVIDQTDSYRLVVVASPRMLGFLREQTEPLRTRLDVEEAALDLTHEPTVRLHQHLVELGLLPAPRAA
ncbi:MAG TPA: host attachment protein [Kofleriaceae bacterium]|nr:host attachment protein [Kofleriaceae bacterium]